MSTYSNIRTFHKSQSNFSSDFVFTDTAALALHMNDCAKNRSGFFGLHAALEYAQALLAPRIVTAAVITLVLLVTTGVV